jgi:3',5'-cyclic AMP phosphodiesterase CpdA
MALEFKNGKFRIFMIADTQEGKNISPDTLALINASLDRAEPDFVVYSGDQIWGKRNFKGDKALVEKALKNLTAPVSKRKIPFAVCFGNHDRQVGVSNEEQFEIYKTFDGFVGESAKNIDGVGNQVIEITENSKVKFLLYLIDSHTNKGAGYDCVHQNQIDWYRKTRDEYEKRCGDVVPSVVIQHIPVCEVYQLFEKVSRFKKGSVRAFRNHEGEYYILDKNKVNAQGFMGESPAEPDENSGEFEAFKEKGEVKGVYFGHDHNNSFNGIVDGIDLGYTQGAGFNVYGPDLNRGTRVIDVFADGHIETFDLRYKNLVGKKVEKPLKYLLLKLAPCNVFEALISLAKLFATVAIILIIILIIMMHM